MRGTDLEIGKRYWLDKRCNISGIFTGSDERGNLLFDVDPTVNNMYLENEEGLIPMPRSADYYALADA